MRSVRVFGRAACAALVVAATAVVAWGNTDNDVGVVHGPGHALYDSAHPTDTVQYGTEGDPLVPGCYDIEVKCLVGATSSGAAITVTATHADPAMTTTFSLDPGEDPVVLHCNWQTVEVAYHSGGPSTGYAGYGVTWNTVN